MKTLLTTCLMSIACMALAQKPFKPANKAYPADEVVVHDPVIAKEGNTYYMYSTGMGITVSSSNDGMKTWHFEKPVFETTPQWTMDKIPNFRGHMWAPDVIYHQGRWHMFYVCSIGGKNTSLIGHISSPTLDPKAKGYGWEDHGMVIQSVPGRDMWNAIDPNIIFDEEGTPWMSFGSWWEGIKLVKMTSDLMALAEPQEWHTLSKRPRSFDFDEDNAGDAPVEAPFIIEHDGYYYLFVSFDYCCRGTESTYKVVVGRSKKVTGPYLDKEGNRMDRDGGSIVVQGNEKWAGIGHNAAYTFEGKDYFVSHAYDRKDGQSYLFLREMKWDSEGWPIVEP
ncbi:MAG: arabinan endo-1,5-alpha-L-arabinosidase [Bacteroidales bacterium]|nr:arabinan endo-1,5-alpha-L-arabinosidase [Bacteroidales bacterium]